MTQLCKKVLCKTNMNKTQEECVLTNNFKYKELLVNEEKYLIGVRKRDNLLQIILTNLVESYEENLTREDIVKKCEDLNKFLIDYNYEKIIDDLFINIPKYAVSCTLEYIKLQYKIEDNKVFYNINLTKSDPKHFHKNFIDNLCFSFLELHHRYSHLLDLVKKKDKEIEEYKAQGIELLRKSLITEPFTEKVFETKLKNTKSADKISVILNVLNFYEDINNAKLNNDTVKEESIKTETDTHEKSSKTNKTVIKRPPSSNLRCAVIPNLEKKAKVFKQNSKYKYL